MNWLVIAAIVFSLLLILSLIAVIELYMFLAPKSFWWRLAHKQGTKVSYAPNEEALRNSAKEWMCNTKHFEQWIYSADNSKLHAYTFPQTNTHRWAICIHGYTGDAETMTCYGKQYYEQGYNVLLPNNRTHGFSQGTFIGMGWRDKDDILLWIEKILSEDPEAQIILHGESMGAATVMMLTGCLLPKNVVCAISDCGYTSVWDVFEHVRKNDMHLSSFPILYIANLLCKPLAGYTLREASCIKQLQKSKTPTLFVHGEDDSFVPASMIQPNFDSCSAKKEMKIFPKARHCQSEFVDPDLYWETVKKFIANCAS